MLRFDAETERFIGDSEADKLLKLTLETRGENLLNGLKNLLEDLDRGPCQLQIRMTDMDAFEVGKDRNAGFRLHQPHQSLAAARHSRPPRWPRCPPQLPPRFHPAPGRAGYARLEDASFAGRAT